MRLGFLASHEGSNLQAVLDACATGRLTSVPAVVITNNGDAPALRRAEAAGVPGYHISSVTHPVAADRDAAMVEVLARHRADLVLTLGYLRKLGPLTLAAHAGRILNIHPSLLPRHGGRGMYGMAVHEAVIAAGDTNSGATVHVVSGDYDTGPVLRQRTVAVGPADTPDSLAARVLRQEHALVVATLSDIESGRLDLPSPAPP